MDHHVYLTRATDIQRSQVPEKYKTQSTDVMHIVVDKFGIPEARQLVKESIQSAVGKEGRVFVVAVKTITVQAQNALLKLFEEPPAGVRFYLVVSPGVDLIPTLLSRVMTLAVTDEDHSSAEFKEFKRSAYQERLALITEKTKAKDIAWVDLIASNFMFYAHDQAKPELMKSAVLVNRYLHSSGSARKMLLEEVALTLPQE